jgi:hypothetical protein
LTVKRGIIARDLVTGEIERHSAHAVVTSGGYGNVFFLSTYAMGSNATAKSIKKERFLPILATQNTPLYPRFRRSPV